MEKTPKKTFQHETDVTRYATFFSPNEMTFLIFQRTFSSNGNQLFLVFTYDVILKKYFIANSNPANIESRKYTFQILPSSPPNTPYTTNFICFTKVLPCRETMQHAFCKKCREGRGNENKLLFQLTRLLQEGSMVSYKPVSYKKSVYYILLKSSARMGFSFILKFQQI